MEEAEAGKTTFCFESMKDLIKEKEKIYIITPEQFSFTAEKKLMETLEKKAVMNAEVITFERMAYRIINEVSGITDSPITNCGKAMLLTNIIQKQKENLVFLGKTDIDLVIKMITEFKKNNVTTTLLEEKIEQIEDEYIKRKLKDIYLLYQDFQKHIENNYLDDDDLLTIIKDKIIQSNLFKNSYIYIDEFAGFTKQEYSIIEELIKIDSLEEGLNAESDLFYPNKNTVLKLRKLAKKNHIEEEHPIELTNKYRFKNEELSYLEENLYRAQIKPYSKECNNIQLFLANNPYSEIENISSLIIELVREQNYRYRDISIITKEPAEYASLIKSIFQKYNIPVFIDEKKKLNQNVLVKYVIAILDVFAQSWKMDAVLNFTKTGFLQEVSYEDIYLFEKYCKKYGITGFKKFTSEWTVVNDKQEDIEKLNSIRQKVVLPLMHFKDELLKYKTVKEITESLYKFLEENHSKEILLNKIDKLNEAGKIDLANLYTTSWDLLIEILDELVLVLGEEKVSFESYTNLLKVGFNQSSLGKIPATLDEVIIGDVDRTRNSKKKVIFIIGLNDGKFPSINKNEGFINDEERDYLKGKGIELAKTTKEQIYDENFNIYKAFSVAEEKLYLSYVASDIDGKGLRRSMLLNKIKKIFPKLQEESDIIQKKTYLSSKEMTFDWLLLNIRKYLNGEEIDPIWFEIYALYNEDELYKEKLSKSIEGFSYTNLPEKISKENLKKLYADTVTTSISKLESYRRCPFSYYLKYGLCLSDKVELKLEKLDTGTLMHDIINSFFDRLNENNQNIKELLDEDIEKIVEEIMQEKLALKQNYIFNSIPKYVVLTKRLKKVLIRAIKYIINTLKCSDFKVLGTEIEFGEGKKYEPIEIKLENNKKLEIIGKIDRVDIAENEKGKYIRIIDYKSSVKNIDLNEVVAGIQIQLLTYLDAVSKKENADLAGVLYFNLIEPVIKAKNKHLSEEELEQEIRNNFKMNGLILGDVDVVKMMDNNLKSGVISDIIPVGLKEGEEFNKNSSRVLDEEGFNELQNKVQTIIKDISNEILDGNIDIKPFCYGEENGCKFCKYQSICRFNPNQADNTYNYIGR